MFKKDYKLKVLVLVTAGIFFCLDAVYSSENTLRLPLGQFSRIIETMGTQIKVSIKFVLTQEFEKYASMLYEMSREEQSVRDELRAQDDFPAQLCLNMAAELSSAFIYPEKSGILGLFVVIDEKDKLIGAEIVRKPHYIEDIKQVAIDGIDIIDFKYRNKEIGTMLRKTVFKWLVDKGYDTYVAQIRKKDVASLNNLKKIANEMGFIIKTNPKAFKTSWGDSYYHIVKLIQKDDNLALLIKQNFPETNNISFADLDTGTGEFVTNFTNLLKGYYQNVKGVGVELLGSLVNQARVNGHNVVHGAPDVEGDYESVGLADNSRDIVTINNIESRPWALIAQADRILKINGLIIVTFEKYDIEEGHGIDRSVENDLRQRGYIVERTQFPNDYPHSVKFQEADFILVAWKNKNQNNLIERIKKTNSIDTAI